jgi:hypothetical protein
MPHRVEEIRKIAQNHSCRLVVVFSKIVPAVG